MQNDTNSKVSAKSIVAYGIGDAGCNFCWTFVGNYLMFFYSDVFGIGMTAVATLMLVSRIWDAVNDPIVGFLTDRTHSRWGRYRPWLLIGAPIAAFVLVLTFWAHPDWSDTAKIIYMAATYCTLVLGYTCVNLPYGTLCSAMTQNIDERAKINTSRSIAAMLAINIINIITIPMVMFFGKGNAASVEGYLIVTIIYGCIFVACHHFCFKNTKEVVQLTQEQQNISFGEKIKSVFKNKPYLLALLGQFMFGFVLYGRNADLVYYFTYVEGDATFFSTYSMITILPSLLGAAAFPWAFNKISNKGRTASVFAFLTAAAMASLFFFSPKSSPVLFYTFGALTQFFFSGFNTAIYAIIPDCVEYGEWKTGVRNEGFQYSFISFGNKVGMALGSALLALVLGKAGYIAGAVQNDAVIGVMRHCFSTIPAALWVVTGVGLLFYNLDRKTYNEILNNLSTRK